jgi:hypothetical protein
MKKLLVERFQELAGIKTSGLALREEEGEEQGAATGGEDQGEEAVNDLIDHLDVKKSLFLQIKTPEAAMKLMSSLLEKLPSNIQSMQSKIFRDLVAANETYGGGAARDTKDDMKKYPDPNTKGGQSTRPGMGTGPYAP